MRGALFRLCVADPIYMCVHDLRGAGCESEQTEHNERKGEEIRGVFVELLVGSL